MTTPEYQPYASPPPDASPYIPSQPTGHSADPADQRPSPADEPPSWPASSTADSPAAWSTSVETPGGYDAPAAPSVPDYGPPAGSAPTSGFSPVSDWPTPTPAPYTPPTSAFPSQAPAIATPVSGYPPVIATPASGYPPVSTAPASGYPGYAPVSAAPASGYPGYAPVSAVPASGYPGYAPVSAAPASGFPASGVPGAGYPTVGYPPGTPATPAGGKKRFVITAIVAIVAVLAAATLGVMYFVKAGAYDRQAKLANDRATTISTDEAALARTKADLQAANDANAKLEAQVGDVQNQLTEITHEKDVIAKCINDNDKVFAAIDRHASQSAVNKLIATAEESCSEADKYLS